MALSQLDIISRANSGANTEFLKSAKLDFCDMKAGYLDIGQAADPHGKITSGTIVGQNSTTKKIAPIARALADANVSAANVIVVGADGVRGFRVGMTNVRVIETDGTVRATGRAITEINRATGAITLDGATFSTTTAAGGRLEATDGTQTPYGISWLDANTWTGFVSEANALIHNDGQPIKVLRRAIVVRAKLASDSYVDDDIVALMEAKGFVFE